MYFYTGASNHSSTGDWFENPGEKTKRNTLIFAALYIITQRKHDKIFCGSDLAVGLIQRVREREKEERPETKHLRRRRTRRNSAGSVNIILFRYEFIGFTEEVLPRKNTVDLGETDWITQARCYLRTREHARIE